MSVICIYSKAYKCSESSHQMYIAILLPDVSRNKLPMLHRTQSRGTPIPVVVERAYYMTFFFFFFFF